jgi:hypothetical protein
MARKQRTIPTAKDNPKRSIAKNNRGKGKIAMETAKMDQAQWAQKHDPLFRVKGMKRHERMKGGT